MSPLRHRTIRAETDTWQLIRFQFKESSNIPFLSTGVFFFFLQAELCISCNISSSHGVHMAKLPEEQRSPRPQHSLRLSAPRILSSGRARWHS